MAYKSKRTMLTSIFTILAGLSLAGFHNSAASGQDLPPGVTITANGAFAPPEGLGTFQAMTFVIDVAPGAGLPAHSHPGRSKVMVLQGELTESKPSGDPKIYRAGDSFMEEPGQVHGVTNTGLDSVQLVWTLLLPEGTEPIILDKH